MRAAKVQASLCIHAVSPEPSLLAHTSSESRGTFRPKARSLSPLNGWACAVKICHDGMLEDTNSLDGAHIWNLLGQKCYKGISGITSLILLHHGLYKAWIKPLPQFWPEFDFWHHHNMTIRGCGFFHVLQFLHHLRPWNIGPKFHFYSLLLDPWQANYTNGEDT